MKKTFSAYFGDGQYLKKEDLSDPVDTELLWLKEEKVTPPGKDTKTQLVAYFEGLSKGLPLNKTNSKTLTEIAGTNDPNECKDVALQLYVDPDVEYRASPRRDMGVNAGRRSQTGANIQGNTLQIAGSLRQCLPRLLGRPP